TGDQAESVQNLRLIEANELCRSRCGTEGSACARGMKSILIVAGRDRFRDLAFHLHAQVVGEHEFLARNISLGGKCQDRGKYGHGRMDQQAVYAVLRGRELRVVKIIGMNRNSIHECGEAWRGFERRSRDGGLSSAYSHILQILAAYGSGFSSRSCQG